MCQDMGWSLPSWRPGLVQGACLAATRPKEAVGRDSSQRPGPSLSPPDFHLLALKCHPSSAPLPATPHRAAAPSTAPAAGAWRHSPVGLARGPWGSGSGRAQGTAPGLLQRRRPALPPCAPANPQPRHPRATPPARPAPPGVPPGGVPSAPGRRPCRPASSAHSLPQGSPPRPPSARPPNSWTPGAHPDSFA